MNIIKWSRADTKEFIGSNGKYVKQFEKDFARYVGAKYALAVNNGTSALLCALLAINPPIISVPSFTFIATVNMATVSKGKKPILLDCGKDSWNVNQKCNVSVDIGGLPVDYDKVKPIISDSAESLGATYKGKPIGTQAKIHTFSFHTTKIITTGEGGMCTTNSKELYERMRSIANHGYDFNKKPWEYKHKMVGYNFRLTDPQARIGISQLKKINKYLNRRKDIVKIYRKILGNKVTYQEGPIYCKSSNFFFGILVENQEQFCKRMYKKGVEVKTWTAVHLQKPYKGWNLPNAEYISEHIVLLPINNKLTMGEAKYVANTAKDCL